MFTGLVESLGTVEFVKPVGSGARISIFEPSIAAGATIGDSISVNGCCLTVVDLRQEAMEFDAVNETIARTNLGHLAPGDVVNLETSLKVGDELGGHFVTGHIDAVARVEQRDDREKASTMWFGFPRRLARQMASKGSVAIDGVSMTLVDVEDARFSVAVIPHTLEVTTLGRRGRGDSVNIETDVLAKYVERQLADRSDC